MLLVLCLYFRHACWLHAERNIIGACQDCWFFGVVQWHRCCPFCVHRVTDGVSDTQANGFLREAVCLRLCVQPLFCLFLKPQKCEQSPFCLFFAFLWSFLYSNVVVMMLQLPHRGASARKSVHDVSRHALATIGFQADIVRQAC